MNDCLVIIPTYNEIENVESIIRTVLSQHKFFHVLIIDDNSPDHTADKVIALQSEFSDRLFLEKRAKKAGLGTAYVHGFKWALENKYNYIFEMDADFSHNPKDLIKLYNACANQLNSTFKPTHREPRAGDIRNSLADIQMTESHLGYHNPVPFEEGMLSYLSSIFVRD